MTPKRGIGGGTGEGGSKKEIKEEEKWEGRALHGPPVAFQVPARVPLHEIGSTLPPFLHRPPVAFWDQAEGRGTIDEEV